MTSDMEGGVTNENEVVHPSHWKLNNGIRRFRIARGISQYVLAANTQIPQRTISAYELGEASPSLDALRKIAEELKCSVPELTENNSKAFAHRRSKRSPFSRDWPRRQGSQV